MASIKSFFNKKSGISNLLKQVWAFMKFFLPFIYGIDSIVNLAIFPLFDSRAANPPRGTRPLPVEKSNKLLNSFWLN